jgi:hypothetical protein
MIHQRSLRRGGAVVLIAGLWAGGWTERSLALESKPRTDTEKALSHPQTATLVRFIERQLRGNDDTWYVVVLRIVDHGIKRFTTVLAQGRTAAAVQITKFLQRNPRILRYPNSYRRWLHVETFSDQGDAELRYEVVNGYR